MGRLRVREYLDIPLQVGDLVKLKKGYKVLKAIKGQSVSIFVDGKDRKKEREIARLKAKIRELSEKK